MKRKIHQLVDTLVPGDAISNDCMQIHSFLNELGYESHIYARASLIPAPFIHNFRNPIPEDADIIFHHSTYSPLVERVAYLSNKKVLIYHNITPAAFFKNYNSELLHYFKEAEKQNYYLSQIQFDGVIGDSRYNLSQIQDFITAKNEAVIPPFLRLQFFDDAVAYKVPKSHKKNDSFTILFVGRFAPNKRQMDIVKIFEFYVKFVNPKAKLVLVGHHSFIDPYFIEINRFITERDIPNIEILGSLTSLHLAEVYSMADVLLCMSEHEGFCIPVLESIHFDVPVLAYSLPALEELIPSEYLLNTKDVKTVAAYLLNIQKDKEYRDTMLSEQKKVFSRFQERDIKNSFKQFINQVFNA